jgi:uncharacterized protein (TIGR00369 family)
MSNYIYGLASPSDVAGLTGKEILQAIINGRLPQAPISQQLTFWITEVGDGFAVFEGEPGPHLLNPMGGVHGGWGLTMIDSAGQCAARSLLPAGLDCTTIETKGNFSRPITVRTGRVRAEARAVSQGRQIISAEVRVLGRTRKYWRTARALCLCWGLVSEGIASSASISPSATKGGTRVLLDRSWPRGVSKNEAIPMVANVTASRRCECWNWTTKRSRQASPRRARPSPRDAP